MLLSDMENQKSILHKCSKVFMTLMHNPLSIFHRLEYYLLSPFYQDYILPIKVRRVRNKRSISVLFVLNELGAWKTETLYKKMLGHPRFITKLLLVPTIESPDAIDVLKAYLNNKGYKYDVVSDDEKEIKECYSSDIIFYQKPYEGQMEDKYFYLYHLDSLFCYVLYGFRNRNYPQIKKYKFIKFIWQFYAENEKVIEESVPVFSTKAKNMVNTGLPFMDDLLQDKSFYDNPWKECGNKKKIIYAPHHTIFSDLYEYATFLDYCDFMLEMAEKYKDKVQWAFKPHPVLKSKLYSIWGKEKTDSYYKKWESLDNGQVSYGEYMGLFKHSDAMIHDCGSFRLEYLYTGNPVMFLQKGEVLNDYMNWQTEEALNLHYKGYNMDDIEGFIKDVINGNDKLKDKRKDFVDTYLTPPNGKSACDNIINAILGKEEFAIKCNIH